MCQAVEVIRLMEWQMENHRFEINLFAYHIFMLFTQNYVSCFVVFTAAKKTTSFTHMVRDYIDNQGIIRKSELFCFSDLMTLKEKYD